MDLDEHLLVAGLGHVALLELEALEALALGGRRQLPEGCTGGDRHGVWWWCGGWSAVDATLGKESAGARKSRGKLGRGLGSKDEGKELPKIDLSERKRGWNVWRDGGKGEKRVEGVDGRLQASAKVK